MKISGDDGIIRAILSFYGKGPRVRMSRLLSALEELWLVLYYLHPSLPEVTIYVTSDNGEYYGWADVERNAVTITQTAIGEGEEAVFGTLLHEAAHFLSAADGLVDFTPTNWHNEHFKTSAKRMGLKVGKCDYEGYGYSTTKPTKATRKVFKRHLKEIKEAING